jgi:hypothetical protein
MIDSTNLRGSPRGWFGRRLLGLALLVLLASLAAVLTDSAARADPVQHVWVHYDYLVGPNGESFAPDPAGIQIVVDAFKQHGVILHIDPQHTAIPLHSVIVFDVPGSVYSFDPACTGPDAVGFSALKAQYFNPTSDHPWHYVIFGKYVQIGSFDDEVACYQNHDLPPHSYSYGNTGYAELPGYDFVVTPGLDFDYPNLTDFFDYNTGELIPGWPPPAYAWATWFMHELGHNLGLYHGGYGRPAGGGLFFTDNYKPNYVSVMNYTYSGGLGGMPIIMSSTTTGSGYSYRVDYSDETLAPLDETNLNEPAGVGPTLHPTDYIQWCCPALTFGYGLASGPLDWNNNGTATDTGVSADLNNDGQLTILKGFNDWAEVHQYLADENQHPKQTQGATP